MMEQATQAIDDGKAEAESTAKPSAILLRIITPVELAEYLLALVDRNAGPGIPDFDPQIRAPRASADQNAPVGDVADRVRRQIEKNLLQEHEIAANPRVSWNDAKLQTGVLRGTGEGRVDPFEQSCHRKFGNIRRQRAGVEP